MAHELTGLSTLTIEEIDLLLSSLSDKYSPIEINGKVYIIPDEVNKLIDGLASQLEDLKGGGVSGVS